MKPYHKFTSLLLVTLLLFQSCVIYKSAPSTLEQVASSNAKAKIIYKDNSKMNFTKIEQQDSVYVGYYKPNKIFSKKVKIAIDQNNIEKIKIQDKTLSAVASTTFAAAFMTGLYYFIKTAPLFSFLLSPR